MRVDVDLTGAPSSRASPESASRRLRFVLARYERAVLSAALSAQGDRDGRVRLSVELALAGGEQLVLVADDDATDGALDHFIDRIGRAVARRLAALDRRRRDV